MAKKKVPIDEILNMSSQGYTDADIIKYLRSEGYSATEINDAINQAKVKQELARTAGAGEEEEFPLPEEQAEGEEYVGEEGAEAETGEEMEPSIMGQEEQAVGEEYVGEEGQAPEYAEAELPEAPAAEGYAPAPEAEQAYPYAYAKPSSTEAMEELAEEIINEKWQEFKTKTGDVGELKTKIESRIRQIDDRLRKLESAYIKLQTAVVAQIKQSNEQVKGMSSEVDVLQNTFSQILQPLISSVKELRDLTEEIKGKKTKIASEKLETAMEKLEKISKPRTTKPIKKIEEVSKKTKAKTKKK